MNMFNSNDILILRCIFDKDDNRGLSIAKGSTITQVCDKSGLSESKVRATIRKLKNSGLISEGIKHVSKKSYYITDVGIEKLKLITKNTSLEG